MPHTVTCLSQTGAGQCELEDGWEDEIDVDAVLPDVKSALDNAGYDVEISVTKEAIS